MAIKCTVIKLLHICLFNFNYKSDRVVLRHSHITAVFVNMKFSDKDKILTKLLTNGRFDYEHG